MYVRQRERVATEVSEIEKRNFAASWHRTGKTETDMARELMTTAIVWGSECLGSVCDRVRKIE